MTRPESEFASEPGEPPIAEPTAPLCRHLRNKGMYVYHGEYDSPHDDYDNTIYWCVKTQKGFGPDDEMCSREDCTIPERVCYEPL
ncbi:MAG TPA: hypothetical protein VGH33_11920 [Isosphaeraceae bacterium]